MLLKNLQLALFQKQGSQLPGRLIFAEQSDHDDDDQKSGATNTPRYQQIPEEEYKQEIRGLVAKNILDQAEANKKLAEAEKYYTQQHNQKSEKTEAQKKQEAYEKALKTAEDKRWQGKESKKALAEIETGRVSTLAELRGWVRGELEELGLDFKDEDRVHRREIAKVQDQLFKRIKSLLNPDERTHQKILQEYEKDNKAALECYNKLRSLFADPAKVDFIRYLASKNLPSHSKEKDNDATTLQASAKDILQLQKKIAWPEAGPGSDQYYDFLYLTDRPHLLRRSINLIEDLHSNWSKAKVEEKKLLIARIDGYESSLGRLGYRIMEDPHRTTATQIAAEEWPALRKSRENDIEVMREILRTEKDSEGSNIDRSGRLGATTESDLRLVNAILTAHENEILEEEKTLEQANAIAKADTKIAEKDDTKDEQRQAEELKRTTSVSTPQLTIAKSEDDGINNIYKKIKNVFTAKGRVQWYSLHDIAEAFKLVKEALEKHADSVSQDKAGTLGQSMLFWRPVVQERAKLIDRSGEKSRAEDLKKTLINEDYEKLIAELNEPPTKDKRRAILEVLADRGNLRMSDRRLVNAVIPKTRPITEAEWIACEGSGDYTPIRDKFKYAIDNEFIGEIGYGKELFNKQDAGVSNKKSEGEKYLKTAAAGSGRSEAGMMISAIDKASLEGGSIIAGMLKESVSSTGNLQTNNASFSTVEILGEKGLTTMDANCTIGLIALKIVDGYLRGNLDIEMIQQEISVGAGEGAYKPLCAFEDVLVNKVNDPKNKGRKVTQLEAWGWIKNGRITELGQTQIINFFDTRVAWDDDGKPIHIGADSFNYARHSEKAGTIDDLKVNDKMLSGCVKANSLDLYDNATRMHSSTSKLNARTDHVKGLIKAATEEIIDASIMRQSKRYQEGKDKFFCQNTDARLERGIEALVLMFDNLATKLRDPTPFLQSGSSASYRVTKRNYNFETEADQKEYGTFVKQEAPKAALRDFIENELAVVGLKNNKPGEYQRIMDALARLERQAVEKVNVKKQDRH
jgi:hypothetical protein